MDKEDGMVNTRLAFYFVKIRVQRKKTVIFDNAIPYGFKIRAEKIYDPPENILHPLKTVR